MSQRSRVNEPDVFDILSATWILACNDENPIMTYEGIRYRLNLSKDYDVKGLIQCRGDLFRKGLPDIRMIEWKEAMHDEHHLPSWIRDTEDIEERKRLIDELTSDDVFRSQFRAKKDAPTSAIELTDWGLQHIDRLRKASLEAHEQSAKSWQMWLLFVMSLIGIVVQLLK